MYTAPPRTPLRRTAQLAALSLLVVPAAGQFVERANELGLVHECVPGLDLMPGPAPANFVVIDWVQQGVSVGDLDGDGDPDVLAMGGVGRNTILRNDGPLGFVDVTATSGIEGYEFDRVATLGDYDDDGDLDVFIGVLEGGGLGASEGRSRMYRNDGTGVFEEVTCLTGTVGRGHSLCAQWHDLDRDGLLDLYVGEFLLTPNAYYRNNGDGTFTELAAELGIDDAGSAHTVAVFDSDDSGDPDLFIGNDFDVAKIIGIPAVENQGSTSYHGQGFGVFTDSSAGSSFNIDRAPMGSAVADVDYDGLGDIYQSDIGRNPLFLNRGWPGSGMPWMRAEPIYGIANSQVLAPGGTVPQITSGWAVVFLHADSDPWIDVLVVNGQVAGVQPFSAVMERDQQNFLFLGDGPPDFHFSDASAAYGVDTNVDDRGGAAADMDGDLDVDFFVTPTAGALRYYENQEPTAGAQLVKVLIESHTSAPDGVGARVSWVDALGHPHVRWMGADSPTASQNANELVFALGAELAADFTIQLPSGITLSYPGVAAGSTLVAVEPELLQLSTRTLPIPSLASAGDPTEVEVTVFAHDATGTPLDGSAAVAINAPGLVATGPVVNVGGNAFRRSFLPATAAGDHRVEVVIDGWPVGIRPRIHCVGQASPSESLFTVNPHAVRAASADEFEVCFTPRDANGVGLGPGSTVDFEVAGLAFVPVVEDLGDGRYTAVFPAAPNAGSRDINVTFNGFTVPSVGSIEFGGSADAAQTEIEQLVALPAQSASPNQLKILVTPRDAAGLRLGDGVDVRLALRPPATPQRGVRGLIQAVLHAPLAVGKKALDPPQLYLRSEFADRGRIDGSYLFIMEKSPDLPGLPTGTLYLTIDGELITSVPFDWDPTN